MINKDNKYCFVIPSLSSGGAERVISILTTELSNMGIDTFLIVHRKNNNEYEIGSNVNVVYLDNVTNKESPFQAQGMDLKVPQIGWNSLQILREDCPLLRYTQPGDYVYYVHSFYATGCEQSLVAGSEYGVFVPGVVCAGNVYGTQFHPEKSGGVGLNILRAFCGL